MGLGAAGQLFLGTCYRALRGIGGNVEAKQNLNWQGQGASLVCLLMVVLAVGCGSQAVRGPVDARAAGGLDARSGRTLVPSDLAFGRDVALASRSERASADIDAYLKPQPAAPARTPARKRAPAPAAPALPPPPAIGLAPEAEAAAQTEQAAPQQLLAANTLPGGDHERYAQRERRSRDVQGYRGGDAIVITSSALIVALLIVLLIVLLT
jgi:hypothetical protein